MDNAHNGFTLIELIITLLLVAVLASMVGSFYRAGIVRSADPLNNMAVPLALQQIMARIEADYQANYLNNPAGLAANVVPPNYGLDGTSYLATTMGLVLTTMSTANNQAVRVTVRHNGGASNESLSAIFTKQQ